MSWIWTPRQVSLRVSRVFVTRHSSLDQRLPIFQTTENYPGHCLESTFIRSIPKPALKWIRYSNL